MAEIKISQLPAKAANLAATDLLEVSEVSGLTYVSKKITGAELIGNVVPYTGATQDVDLGEYELKAGQIELDQSPTGTAGVAVTRWNNTIGSTETTLKGGSVILKNGVDLVARVVNKVSPNATLTKAAYQVVKISGVQGQRLAVDYAQANNDNNSADTLGVVIETIPTNQEGFIMTVGQLEGINTTGSLQGETWLDGDVLYLSPTTPGAVTKVKPTGATGHIVIIGYVEYAHANNGKIYVKIMNGWELDELHNVYINNGTLANNQVLTYNSTSQLWENKQVTESVISLSDITTNNVSSTKHGFAPKLPNDASKFLDGTGNYTSPPAGITVGTTPVTSGTNGRVFFQAGGVVQQSDRFTFDNTTATNILQLGSGANAGVSLRTIAPGATNLDIAFRVSNSANTKNFLTVNGAGDVFNNGAQGVTSNTFYGENSGRSATGLYNCFFGLTAGRDNSTGSSNSFFGVEAGRINTIGSSNSFFGIQAGTFNTTGGNNSFFGGSAGYSNGGGGYNSFFGGSAGSGNTSGSYNSCFGFAAGEFNSTGSENVFIGDETGRRTSTNANVTVANNSIFIGVLARANANSESNQIVIGHSAIGLGSNTTVIGNSSTTTWKLFGAGIVQNITAPSSSLTDSFHVYSNDITAGNAAPHFRTENGAIVKVYQETTAVASATLVSNAGTAITDTDTFDGYTLKQIVKALRNQGLLA